MTDHSSLATWLALQPDNSDEEIGEPVDKVNAVSLTLATTSILIMLAIALGAVFWK
jgi:hypothetical protein